MLKFIISVAAAAIIHIYGNIILDEFKLIISNMDDYITYNTGYAGKNLLFFLIVSLFLSTLTTSILKLFYNHFRDAKFYYSTAIRSIGGREVIARNLSGFRTGIWRNRYITRLQYLETPPTDKWPEGRLSGYGRRVEILLSKLDERWMELDR